MLNINLKINIMNSNLKSIVNNPISSSIGALFIIFGFLVYFVKTVVEFPYYIPMIAWVIGILLLFAKDKLLDILTLGLSRLVKNINNKIKEDV